MTLITTTKKVALGLFLAIFALTAFAPLTQAQTYYYQYQYQQPVVHQANIQALYTQLYALMAQLQALQAHQGYTYSDSNTYTPVFSNKDYDVEVDTEDVTLEGNDSVSFEGDLELDDAPYANVWFEYGEGGDLTEKTDKERVTRDGSFEIEADDLDDDERYYVRAVAEDPSGVRTYGTLLAFTIDDGYDDDRDDDDDDDRDDDESPEVTTGDARSIDDDRAELRGKVEMNDFDGGRAFFVYGEDEDLVEEVEDEDTYSDIDEEGDDLQKVEVYHGLNGTRDFWLTVSSLNDDTDHYFRMCVEYEDEDDDDVLACGDVEEFTTEEY